MYNYTLCLGASKSQVEQDPVACNGIVVFANVYLSCLGEKEVGEGGIAEEKLQAFDLKVGDETQQATCDPR